MSCHTQRSCGHEWERKRGRFPVPAARFICIVPPLGAFKSQLGGPIFYRCWLISSLSPVIIRIYIYIYAYSSCHLVVGVFARQMHSTSEFAMAVLSKCVNHLNRCKTCTTSRSRGAQKAHRAVPNSKFGASNLGNLRFGPPKP